MDSFTQKLLHRTEARRDYMKNKLAQMPDFNNRKRCSPVKEPTPSSVASNGDGSPKRPCLVPFQPNIEPQIYPVSKPSKEIKNIEEKENAPNAVIDGISLSSAKGLAAIRQQKPFGRGEIKNVKDCTAEELESKTNECCDSTDFAPAPSFLACKEAQGYVKTTSASNVHYSYVTNDASSHSHPSTEASMPRTETPVAKAALYDSSVQAHDTQLTDGVKAANDKAEGPNVLDSSDQTLSKVDPAELPLSARLALFEKKMVCPSAIKPSSTKNTVGARVALFEKAAGNPNILRPKKKTGIPHFPRPITLPRESLQDTKPITVPSAARACEITSLSKPCNGSSTSEVGIINGVAKNVQTPVCERKKEMAALLCHWEQTTSCSSQDSGNSEKIENLDSDMNESWQDLSRPCSEGTDISEESLQDTEETKYSPVRIQKESNCESLSNADSEHSISVESLHHEEQTAGPVRIQNESNRESLSNADREHSISEESLHHEEQIAGNARGDPEEEEELNTFEDEMASDSEDVTQQSDQSNSYSGEAEAVCREIDAFLDEAMTECETPQRPPASEVSPASVCTVESMLVTPPKLPCNLNHEKASAVSTPRLQRGTEENTLMYTVSLYRREKKDQTTPVRTIMRREEGVSSPSLQPAEDTAIQEKIKSLQVHIQGQQTIISQASQALNLCRATVEFSGSKEQVEGERLLLIATQKRLAALNEIQRLKTEGALGRNTEIDGTGTLTINDIRLPLKKEFWASHAADKSGKVHYFLCLIRHRAQVISTQMVSTEEITCDSGVNFTNHVTLQDLLSDFAIGFEVFCLEIKQEAVPHDKKYHIKKDSSKKRLTPRSKKSDSKLINPAVYSPGGPSAVCSTNFILVGLCNITLRSCGRDHFPLENVPYKCPLEGSVHMKIQLHAKHDIRKQGFITVFEDVSGFGAWHRRWCIMDGNRLAFWKYPDDEHRKDAMAVIDLRHCITGQVGLVPRDVCARPHTFKMVTVRPQADGDRDTLISKSQNTLTTTNYLLAADTKDERIMWCERLNQALVAIRKWDPSAMRPIDSKTVEKSHML